MANSLLCGYKNTYSILLIILIFDSSVNSFHSKPMQGTLVLLQNNVSGLYRPSDSLKIAGNLSFVNIIDNTGISAPENGDNNKNIGIVQLVQRVGFKIQEYEVQTQDGYRLKMFRIPGNGSAVLLMHGLFCSADDWVTPGPAAGIPYLLASEGYDVWLGNARGNKYSRRHAILDPDLQAKQFWSFSWDEIGRYDLPAMIDTVLHETGQSRLYYVGHSQGTTAFFVLCSERPDYNNKVSLMVALSAVAWMSRVKSPFVRLFSPLHAVFHSLTELFGLYEFKLDTQLINTLKTLFCERERIAKLICTNFLFLLCGFDYDQINVPYLSSIISHITSSISLKQLVHYGQGIQSSKFRRFDYGILKNLVKYNFVLPPEYKVEKITVPVAIFYSNNDWLADTVDVNILRRKLTNVVSFYQIPHKNFNHLDFIWAKDLKKLVFVKLLELFKRY